MSMDKAIAYLRVSTPDQSLSQQRQALEKWAAANGIVIIEWFEDQGTSGRTPISDRPVLLSAIDAVKTSGAPFLVASARDRLARDVIQMATLEGLLASFGAFLRTVDGSNDDSIEGRLLRQILDAFAEFEAAKIAFRTKAAHASRRARGLMTSGAPYGFRAEGESPRRFLVPVEEEQATLNKIRDWSKQGVGPRAIAYMLNQAGVPARGKKWHKTSVVRCLGRQQVT